MSFIVRKPGAGPVILDSLGITLTGIAASEFSLRELDPKNIQDAADLAAAIAGGTLVVLDPRDDSTALSITDGELARAKANDTHFGVTGGRFGPLDDPTVVISDDFIVQYDLASDSYESRDPVALLEENSSSIGAIIGGMGTDGVDTTFVYDPTITALIKNQDESFYDGVGNNGVFVGGDGVGGTAYVIGDAITLSDGSVATVEAIDVNGDVTDFTITTASLANITAGVTLTQASVLPANGQVGFTLTPEINNISTGLFQWDVNDVFLRNTGDTLDSGTLAIASGAAVTFGAGSTITIDTAVTTATIATPAGGFTGDDDLINKFYVDSFVQGIDWKESVRAATTPGEGDLAGVYVNNGGVGDTLTFDSTLATGVQIDGISYTGASGTGFVTDDRILVKDQTNTAQNGIYTVTAGSTPTVTVLTRATDQDGSPSNEVSGGNTVFVEETSLGSTTNINTIWSVIWDGDIVVNTDPIVWTQTTAASTTLAGIGLSKSVNTIDLDVNDLVTATAVVGDIIAFHDLNGVAEASGSQTRKTTFQSMFNDLDVPNAITSDGFLVRTAEDVYASRSITVNGAGALDGLAVANGDGVAADPTIGLDIQNLPVQTAIDSTDRVAVYDVTAGANVYYSVSDIATALSASDSFVTWLAAGNTTGDVSIVAETATDTATITGGRAINIDFTAVSDTVTYSVAKTADMIGTIATVAGDSVLFFDASNLDTPEVRTWTNVISDLGLITSLSASVNEDLLGIDVTGTVIGFDLLGLPSNGGVDMAATDEFAVHDKSEGTAGANRKITGQNIADGVATIIDPALTAFTSITGDTGTATADTPTDTVSLVGATNGGITTIASDGPESVTFSVTPIDLVTGGAVLATGDFIVVSDSLDTASTVALKYTFGDMITDLGLITSLSASLNEDLTGIDVTGTVIGLDILGLTDPNLDMAATDEFPVHDKSEGTAGANQKMTGQNIADGVAIINGTVGITLSTFIGEVTPANDQTLLGFVDATRGSGTFSVEAHTYQWSDNKLSDNDWLRIGDASDADSGWVMPLQGTVVMASAHCENTGADSYDIDLYIDGADSGPIASLTGGANAEDTDPTLDIDFTAGQKLRLRADRTAGTGDLADTTVALTIRWRV